MTTLRPTSGACAAQPASQATPAPTNNCLPLCSHQRYDDVDQYTMVQSTLYNLPSSCSSATLKGPTPAQKAALLALPSGLLSGNSLAARDLKKKGKRSKMPDGQIVAKFFDIAAGRPYPRIGSLFQTLACTLTQTGGYNFSTSTTVPTYVGLTFALNGLNGYASYTALFDQYIIDELEVWIEPATVTSTYYSELSTAIDVDDGNTPSTTGQVADKQGSLVGLGASGRYHRWVPHVAVATYSGAFTSYGNVPPMWIDVGSPGVQHFGLKIAAAPTSIVISYQISVRAKCRFRDPNVA